MKTSRLLFATAIAVIVVVTIFSTTFERYDANIFIYTNGSITDVTTQGTVYKPISPSMMNDIENKVSSDVYLDSSTNESIKSDVKIILSNYNYTARIKIVSQFGTDQIPMIATVTGTSMVPTLQDGQEIVVLKTKDFKVGDIVVAEHPSYGLVVKRVSVIEANQVYLTSDNKNVEVLNTETQITNGSNKTITLEKKSLNIWLPSGNIIGVVKEY